MLPPIPMAVNAVLYYDNFDNPDLAYSDFISRLESIINVVAPIKTE